MAYEARNILVGAAKVFYGAVDVPIPAPTPTTVSYVETLESTTTPSGFKTIGYTSNGLEIQFAPEFGEVQVDQILDVAKLFKSGMTVTMNTSMAETTLENLALALASSEAVDSNPNIRQKDEVTPSAVPWDGIDASLDLSAGQLGDCPVEKTMIAVGAGLGDCAPGTASERIYTAFRVLSIESVTVSSKRDEASMFDVSFRLLPDKNGYYGQIVDRTYTPTP